jgi:phosphoribosylanthranilate isomerase
VVEVKICGLTRAVDAEYADAAGASYLGVIFAGGPRQRLPQQARDTLAGRRARKVGVFADQAPGEIADIAREVGLDVIQLHAESQAERVHAVRAATGLEVWAVLRTSDGTLPDDAEDLADEADALVVDALVPGKLGGSGVAITWLLLGE